MKIQELQQITRNFLGEIKDANAGRKTTLPYIIHELPRTSHVQEGETFQVLVFGGSIFLNVLLKKTDHRLIILKRERKNKGPFLSKEDFLTVIAEEIRPEVRVVAINFAFPLQPVFANGRLDGILLHGSKEHTFTGLLGKRVGKTVEEYVKKTKKQEIEVSIANDTVCLVLSGLTEVATHDIAGGILGTGMNFAFFLDDRRLVNLEAKDFHTFSQTPEEKAFDKTSAMPGQALLEKATSGAYLYRYYNMRIAKQLPNRAQLEATLELDRVIEKKIPVASDIAREILGRSADLISALIAAITLFKKKDMVFVIEGSLFWNAPGFRGRIKKNLLQIIPQYSVKFVKIEDSPVFGAAKLVA